MAESKCFLSTYILAHGTAGSRNSYIYKWWKKVMEFFRKLDHTCESWDSHMKVAYHPWSVKRDFPPLEKNVKMHKLHLCIQVPRHSQHIHTGLTSYHKTFASTAKNIVMGYKIKGTQKLPQWKKASWERPNQSRPGLRMTGCRWVWGRTKAKEGVTSRGSRENFWISALMEW